MQLERAARNVLEPPSAARRSPDFPVLSIPETAPALSVVLGSGRGLVRKCLMI